VVDGSAVSESWPVRPDVVVPVVFWESGADIVLGLGWSGDSVVVVRSTLESVYEKGCLHGGLGDYVVGTLLGGHFV
jgi:hypothetical protein